MFDVLGRIDVRPLGNDTYPGVKNRTQGIIIINISQQFYYLII